ncbi:MAG: hydrogenase expression/formation protein HypE, partial [Oscillospiraceae bacterium]|nr:hydrogenase expression/formation protein HypE [Oscillospiraceae bacterium]
MDEEISLAHGAGGEAYRQMVQEIFIPGYGSPELSQLGDSAVLPGPGQSGELAFTTDSFVVWPLFFPGGDVGSLAVSGTVNDLSVAASVPRYLSVAMIIEAGFPTKTLQRIAASIAATAQKAGVRVVTGDTKVVEHGRADGIYITTSGVGTFDGGWRRPDQQVRDGDVLLVSGPLASHGVAVMAAREQLEFNPPLQSDARPLAGLIRSLLASGLSVHAMRDPTRGGLGATLCEWADSSGLCLTVQEDALPVRADVRAACALLGLD